MSLFGYNLSQDYFVVQMHQQQWRRELDRDCHIREARTEIGAERRFHRMYRVRHWLFRLAPRLAARLTL